MTKKDYIKIAKAVSASSNLNELVERLIEIMKLDNPNFDEAKFRKAIS
jgi:hypothetical protein